MPLFSGGWLRRITHARQYLPLRSVIGVHAIMDPYLWTLCYRPWICSNDILHITMLLVWVWMQWFLLGLACVPPKSKSMMKRMRSYVLIYLKQVCDFLRFFFSLCCCVWNWRGSFQMNILADHINSYQLWQFGNDDFHFFFLSWSSCRWSISESFHSSWSLLADCQIFL